MAGSSSLLPRTTGSSGLAMRSGSSSALLEGSKAVLPELDNMQVQWYGTVQKIGRNLTGHTRVVFVTETAVFVCLPTGGVTRTLNLSDVVGLHSTAGAVSQVEELAALRRPPLVLQHSSNDDRDRFAAALQAARASLAVGPRGPLASLDTTPKATVEVSATTPSPTRQAAPVHPSRTPIRKRMERRRNRQQRGAANGNFSSSGSSEDMEGVATGESKHFDVPPAAPFHTRVDRSPEASSVVVGATALPPSSASSPPRNTTTTNNNASTANTETNPFAAQRRRTELLRSEGSNLLLLSSAGDQALSDRSPMVPADAAKPSDRPPPPATTFSPPGVAVADGHRALPDPAARMAPLLRPPSLALGGGSTGGDPSTGVGLRPGGGTPSQFSGGEGSARIDPEDSLIPTIHIDNPPPAGAPRSDPPPNEAHTEKRDTVGRSSAEEAMNNAPTLRGGRGATSPKRSKPTASRGGTPDGPLIVMPPGPSAAENELRRDLDHAHGLIGDLQAALRTQESTFAELMRAQEELRAVRSVESSLNAQVAALTSERESLRKEAAVSREEATQLRVELEARDRRHEAELATVKDAFLQYDRNVAAYLSDIRREQEDTVVALQRSSKSTAVAAAAAAEATPPHTHRSHRTTHMDPRSSDVAGRGPNGTTMDLQRWPTARRDQEGSRSSTRRAVDRSAARSPTASPSPPEAGRSLDPTALRSALLDHLNEYANARFKLPRGHPLPPTTST